LSGIALELVLLPRALAAPTLGPAFQLTQVLLVSVVAAHWEKEKLKPILWKKLDRAYSGGTSGKLPASLLIVRCAGDEASAWLGGIHLAQWAAVQAQTVLDVGVRNIAVWTIPLMVIAMVLVLLPIDLGMGVFAFPLLIALFWICLALHDILMFLCGLLMAGASFFFSWDAAASIFHLELSVEETPPGVWPIHQMSFIEQSGQPSVLEHSKIYRDPRTPVLIADWLARQP